MNDQQQNNLNQSGQDKLINKAQSTTNENVDLSGLYLSKNKLQTFAELQEDKNSDNSEEGNGITSSATDDQQLNSNGAADTDSASTAAQKTYGDIELNKGLEAQAKDEES